MSELSNEQSQTHQDFVQEANREQRILSSISRTLESAKVKHQGERGPAVHAVIARLKADGIDFKVSDRNFVVASKGGEPISLQAAVDSILLTDRTIGDPASVQAAVASGELTVEAKSDLSTPSQKSAWLSKHSLAEWEKLPMHRQGPVDMNPTTMALKDWHRLTVSQKVQFQKRADVDEQVMGQILHRR
jgi:hypothetical protein